MLAAVRICKSYRRRSPLLLGKAEVIPALIDVSLIVPQSSTVVIVGRSGSGKTTLARCLSGHDSPDCGSVTLDGESVPATRRARRIRRRAVQLVFQDAGMSFSSWMSLEQIVSESMQISGVDAGQRRKRCAELFEQVQLPASWMTRSSRELSGGQRNRIAIARALAADPQVLILDEVSSGLDLTTRNHLFDMLRTLQLSTGIAYVVISHDLRVAAQIANHIAVIDAGRIVESRPASELLDRPEHPTSRALIDAVSNPQRNPMKEDRC